METKGRLSAVLLWLFLSCSVWGQLNIGPSTGPRPATPVSYQSGSSPTQPNAPTTLGSSQPPSNLSPVTNSNLPPSGASLAPVASDRTLLTVEGIVARQTQLQSTNEIDPNLKQALGQLYESILAELRAKAETERLTKELAASAEVAPTATQEARKKKENLPASGRAAERLGFWTVEELRKELQVAQANLQAVVDQRTRIEAAMTSRDARRKELPRLVNEEKEILRKLTDELALPIAQDVDVRVVELQRTLIQAKRETSLERSKKLESEQRAYEAEAELLPLRKELLSADEKQLQAKIKDITDELNKRRESLIQKEKSKIEQMAAETSPRSKTTTDRLVKRVNDWLELAKANSAIQLEIEAAKARRSVWSERYKLMKKTIDPESTKDVGSFNSLVGLMLRRQQSELPDPKKLQSQLREYEAKMVQTEALILELDDWTTQLSAMEQGDLLNVSGRSANSGSVGVLLGETEKLLATEKELIANFRIDAANYFDNLFSLADAKREMINLVFDYRDFVDQHILWMRSSDRLDKGEVLQSIPALEWLCRASNWQQVGEFLYRDALAMPWLAITFLVLLVAIAWNLARIRKKIGKLGETAEKTSTTRFLPTVQTIALSLLASLPLPMVLAYVGWRISSSDQSQPFVGAVGFSCLAAARYFMSLEIIRQFCRKGGLVEKHFRWSERVTYLIRTNLRWLIDLGIPHVALVSLISRAGDEKWESSLGRIAFCVLMVLCGVFLFRILRPKDGIFTPHLKEHSGGWADRLRYLWYCGLAIGPCMLAVLSMMGYHYTAQRLAMHLHTSIITLVGMVLLHSLLRRWFMLSRRTIIISQARARLNEAQKRDPVSSAPVHSLKSEIDLAEINAQTMRLVSSVIALSSLLAVAFIWSGVLPAVGALNSIELWEVVGSNQKMIPITLANVLLAIPIMAMTIVGARNLPGLLEIALLQHLPLENAVRYAIATLSRYAILLLGIAMTFNSVGVRWSSIQWLVAALGVGLGFGLQEIFANFISGLILLFEQPIRVGDVITLGETTGSVSRIRMRATTITNFDRQELIIPNKDLITGRLLNWTLSDSTNRLKLHVSVAYGTDTEAACKILRDICTNHPNVLKDPAPSAFLEDMGDSALVLTVRIFLESLEHRLQTRHELHSQFHRAFHEAGINIPFPQRDLHIKSISPSLARLLNPQSNQRAA